MTSSGRGPCGVSLRKSGAFGFWSCNLNPARLPIPPPSLVMGFRRVSTSTPWLKSADSQSVTGMVTGIPGRVFKRAFRQNGDRLGSAFIVEVYADLLIRSRSRWPPRRIHDHRHLGDVATVSAPLQEPAYGRQLLAHRAALDLPQSRPRKIALVGGWAIPGVGSGGGSPVGSSYGSAE